MLRYEHNSWWENQPVLELTFIILVSGMLQWLASSENTKITTMNHALVGLMHIDWFCQESHYLYGEEEIEQQGSGGGGREPVVDASGSRGQ
jgi:hypothetical protein